MTDDDPCTSSPCQNGMCQKIDQIDFQCICQDGYTGQYCDTMVTTTATTISYEAPSLCNPSPCYPGVSCSHQDWYFTCGPCPSGLTGDGITCVAMCSDNDVTCDTQHLESSTETNAGLTESVEIEASDCTDNVSACFTDHCLSDPCYPDVTCTSLGTTYSW